MTEAQVGLLVKAASTLAQNETTKTSQILKSYYLMRCKSLTKDSLPKKQFSNEVRCSRCCIEWSNDTEVKLNPIKLSKRQKKRMKSKRKTNESSSQMDLFHSNELVRTCSFCSKSIKSTLIKPNKVSETTTTEEKHISSIDKVKVLKKYIKEINNPQNQELQSSVYRKSKAAFSLKEKRNILQSTIKVPPPKVIRNNKKKKDKFAGLCKNAVVAAVQSKKEKESKLNLFLKPSS